MAEHLTSGKLLDAVRGLHWPARRVARSPYGGGHRSRRVGPSPEFIQYREYRPGDEASKIDWRLYGRTGRVSIRETRDDSNMRTTILVDASASMAFPESTMAKWSLATALAFGLAAVTQGDRDPVGLAVVSETGVRVLAPRARMSVTANVLRVLNETEPAGSRPLTPVLELLRSSDRIAIISDFLGDADELLEASAQKIVSGCEVFAVHVVADEELDPEDTGNIVVDPEEESIRRPFDASGLDEYRRAFAAWRQDLATRWSAAGAVYQLATTGEPVDRVIRRVVSPSGTSAEAHVAS